MLDEFKNAKTLSDLANILGYKPSSVSYILYKIDSDKKYIEFKIPKKSGGMRIIQAPVDKLSRLQSCLAEKLYMCVKERKEEYSRFWFASHGFHRGRTIISNAEVHRRRRYVFNLDLKDFFGTINFGRVRGFFIRDKMFALEPAVATVIAQIVCHENALPQGSPCSPVISNLIGNILDSRLLALARDTHCTYTRYADDLTFSTNEKNFSHKIAVIQCGSEWVVGEKLRTTIEQTGFTINSKKTRMSLRSSRQMVTGLVVNKKVNINQDYYRAVRVMCHSLFQTGSYHRPSVDEKKMMDSINPLGGMLSFIYFVKARLDIKDKSNKITKKQRSSHPEDAPKALTALYKKFLFYKYFIALKYPLIVTEGKTDNTYLKCAIRALASKFPHLATEEKGKTIQLVQFLNPSYTLREILGLGQGTGGQSCLIGQYSENLKKYMHKPMEHPVIVLCDNDDGIKNVLNVAKKKIKKKIKEKEEEVLSICTTSDFYYLGDNLYLVKIPEDHQPNEGAIEFLFEKSLREEMLNGKSLKLDKEHKDHMHYSKSDFAEKVVRVKAKKFHFSGFESLLSRIESVIKDYKNVLARRK